MAALPMVSTVTVAQAKSASSSTECLIPHKVGSRWATSWTDPAGYDDPPVSSVSVRMTWGKGGVSVKKTQNGGYSSDEDGKRRWTIHGDESRRRTIAGESPDTHDKKKSKRYSFKPSRTAPAPPPEAPGAESAEAAHANALAKLTGSPPTATVELSSPRKKKRRFSLRSLPARPPTPDFTHTTAPPLPNLLSLKDLKGGMSFAMHEKQKRGWGEYDAFGALADRHAARTKEAEDMDLGQVTPAKNPFNGTFIPVSPLVGEERRAKRLSRHGTGDRPLPPATLPLAGDMLAGAERPKRESMLASDARRQAEDGRSKDKATVNERPKSMPAGRPPHQRTIRRKPPPKQTAEDIFAAQSNRDSAASPTLSGTMSSASMAALGGAAVGAGAIAASALSETQLDVSGAPLINGAPAHATADSPVNATVLATSPSPPRPPNASASPLPEAVAASVASREAAPSAAAPPTPAPVALPALAALFTPPKAMTGSALPHSAHVAESYSTTPPNPPTATPPQPDAAPAQAPQIPSPRAPHLAMPIFPVVPVSDLSLSSASPSPGGITPTQSLPQAPHAPIASTTAAASSSAAPVDESSSVPAPSVKLTLPGAVPGAFPAEPVPPSAFPTSAEFGTPAPVATPVARAAEFPAHADSTPDPAPVATPFRGPVALVGAGVAAAAAMFGLSSASSAPSISSLARGSSSSPPRATGATQPAEATQPAQVPAWASMPTPSLPSGVDASAAPPTAAPPPRSSTPPAPAVVREAPPAFGTRRSSKRPSTAPSAILLGPIVAAHAALASTFEHEDGPSRTGTPPAEPPSEEDQLKPLHQQQGVFQRPAPPAFGATRPSASRPSTAPSVAPVRAPVAKAPNLLAPSERAERAEERASSVTPPATAESGVFPHHAGSMYAPRSQDQHSAHSAQSDLHASTNSHSLEAYSAQSHQSHIFSTQSHDNFERDLNAAKALLPPAPKFTLKPHQIAPIPPFSPPKRAVAPVPTEYVYDRPAAHAGAAESLRRRHGLSPEPPEEARHLRVSQYGDIPELDFTRTPPPERQEEIERERARKDRPRSHTPSEPDAVLQTPATSDVTSVPSAVSHSGNSYSHHSHSYQHHQGGHSRTPSGSISSRGGSTRSTASVVSAAAPSVSAFTDRLPASQSQRGFTNLLSPDGVEGLISAQHTGATGATGVSAATGTSGSGMATVESSPRAPSWIDYARPPRILELEAAVMAAAAAATAPIRDSAIEQTSDIRSAQHQELDASTTRGSPERAARESRRYGFVNPNAVANAHSALNGNGSPVAKTTGKRNSIATDRPGSVSLQPVLNIPPPPPHSPNTNTNAGAPAPPLSKDQLTNPSGKYASHTHASPASSTAQLGAAMPYTSAANAMASSRPGTGPGREEQMAAVSPGVGLKGPAMGQFTSAQWAKLQPIPPAYASALSQQQEEASAAGMPASVPVKPLTSAKPKPKPKPMPLTSVHDRPKDTGSQRVSLASDALPPTSASSAVPASVGRASTSSRPTTPATATQEDKKSRFSLRPTSSSASIKERETKKRFSLLRSDLFATDGNTNTTTAPKGAMGPPPTISAPIPAAQAGSSAPSVPAASDWPAGGVGSRLSGITQTPLPPPPTVSSKTVGRSGHPTPAASTRREPPAFESGVRRSAPSSRSSTAAQMQLKQVPEIPVHDSVSRSGSVASRRNRRFSFKPNKKDKPVQAAPPVPSPPPVLPLPSAFAEASKVGLPSTEAIGRTSGTVRSRSERSDPTSIRQAVPLHQELEASENVGRRKERGMSKFMRGLRGLFKSSL